MSQWLDICWLEVKQKEQTMHTYKEEQQNLTDLNADGNRERGEEGEDMIAGMEIIDADCTDQEVQDLRDELEELKATIVKMQEEMHFANVKYNK